MHFSEKTTPLFSRIGGLSLGRGISACLCLIAGSVILSPSSFATENNVLTGDIRVTVHPDNIRESLPVPGATRHVTMSLHGVEVQDVLRALAKQGGFNVLLDESVHGTISVDLNNVTIQDALETVKTYGNLVYSLEGRNLTVAEASSAKGQALRKSATRIFPLHNANAAVIATFLNSTVFADHTGAAGSSAAGSGAGSGATPGGPVTADYHTNSLIVVGTPTDIRTVEKHIAALDQPRERRTWRLSHARALDVATMLSSSLFNEGQPAVITGGSGSSSSASPGASQSGTTPGTLRVTADNIAEGTGASQSSQSGGGSGGSSALANNMTLRARVQQTQTIQLSPSGPIIMPDTRLNTITLMGTAEQIAMAEAMIPTLDRKVPQVALEASLVEISDDGRKELGFTSGGNSGRLSYGSNNSASTTLINRAFSNSVGRVTSSSTPLESLFRFTTNSLNGAHDFLYQVNALVSRNKAKMLANPTVITTSDNEALISIVDEIIRSVTVTQGTVNNTQNFTTNIGDAGIILNILPKIGANGTVSLRVRPVVSSVARTETDRFGNVVTLLSKRETLAQNIQLKDGETFVLAGLLHDTNTEAIARNPLLSGLPIVGALARNTTNSNHRSELVIMITPHIINDDETTIGGAMPRYSAPAGGSGSGIQPVSLLSPTSAGTSTPSRSALPRLEKPHIIGDGDASSAPEQSGPLFHPTPHPVDKSKSVQTAAPTPEQSATTTEQGEQPTPSGATRVFSRKSTLPGSGSPEIQVHLNQPAPAKTEQAIRPAVTNAVHTGASDESISDDSIRAIMDKFNP